MIRSISPLICIFLGITFSVSTQAQAADLTKSFGIGLQGATPAYALLDHLKKEKNSDTLNFTPNLYLFGDNL